MILVNLELKVISFGLGKEKLLLFESEGLRAVLKELCNYDWCKEILTLSPTPLEEGSESEVFGSIFWSSKSIILPSS